MSPCPHPDGMTPRQHNRLRHSLRKTLKQQKRPRPPRRNRYQYHRPAPDPPPTDTPWQYRHRYRAPRGYRYPKYYIPESKWVWWLVVLLVVLLAYLFPPVDHRWWVV